MDLVKVIRVELGIFIFSGYNGVEKEKQLTRSCIDVWLVLLIPSINSRT